MTIRSEKRCRANNKRDKILSKKSKERGKREGLIQKFKDVVL